MEVPTHCPPGTVFLTFYDVLAATHHGQSAQYLPFGYVIMRAFLAQLSRTGSFLLSLHSTHKHSKRPIRVMVTIAYLWFSSNTSNGENIFRRENNSQISFVIKISFNVSVSPFRQKNGCREWIYQLSSSADCYRQSMVCHYLIPVLSTVILVILRSLCSAFKIVFWNFQFRDIIDFLTHIPGLNLSKRIILVPLPQNPIEFQFQNPSVWKPSRSTFCESKSFQCTHYLSYKENRRTLKQLCDNFLCRSIHEPAQKVLLDSSPLMVQDFV